MKKKIISFILAASMLIPFCFTAYAAENNTNSLDAEISARIQQIVSNFFSNSPGQYVISNSITIYNADTDRIYYIIPILRNQACVGVVELDMNGNVVLTDDITLYMEISELSFDTFLLYTTGGIVYAESPTDVVDLYNTGIDFPQNDEFVSLSYLDKVEIAKVRLEKAALIFDISAVIEEMNVLCLASPEVSLFAVDLLVESESCSMTTFVEQSTDKDCWAACVATIVNYKNGTDISDADVAASIGLDCNSGGSTADTLSALSAYGLSYRATGSYISWTSVKNNILNDRPFIIGLVTTYANGNKKGHMITGYGYSCQRGDAEEYASSRYIYAWDPQGAKISFQYDAPSFSMNGYPHDWKETLVD